MSAPHIFVQLTGTPMGSNSGQPIANPRTIMVEVPRPRIDIHRERHKVGDYFVQGRRRWVRLHEKGGKEHDVPCHHRLDQCLHDYIEAAGITDDIDGYLFHSARRKTGQLTTNPLFQQDAHRIIRRRAKAAGIETRIGNHTFRATGITAYLKNSGKLEVALFLLGATRSA
jgi:integrase